MAIAIEFCSLVVPRDVAAQMPGGIRAFESMCRALNGLTDASLARVSAMSTREIVELADALRAAGLPPTWRDEPATAIVDLGTTNEQVPTWLRIGPVDGCQCVWLADAEPGEVVRPFKNLMTRVPASPLPRFSKRLEEAGIRIVSADARDEVVFVRGDDSVPGSLLCNDEQLLIVVVTYAPPPLFGRNARLKALIDDINAVTSKLVADAD